MRVYYSLAVWWFEPILSASLRFHSHLSGGLRLRNYRAVAGNHKFSFCGGYSNRVKRLKRLSGNFILLKASIFNKGLPFRARPSQSGLPSVSPVIFIKRILAHFLELGAHFPLPWTPNKLQKPLVFAQILPNKI